VVLYFDVESSGERQCTVATAERGPLRGRRSRARLRWPPVALNQYIAAAESSSPLKHSFQ
jgi:hypothetical protein